MAILFLQLFCCCLCLIFFHGEGAAADGGGKAGDEQVSISVTQYCTGCIYTVQAFSEVSQKQLAQMSKNNVQAGEAVDASALSYLICDDEFFVKYKRYIHYSCIKIFNDHRTVFLQEFVGDGTADSMTSKAIMHQRTRGFCFDKIKACTSNQVPDLPPAPTRNRDVCYACSALATLFDMSHRAFNTTKLPRNSPIRHVSAAAAIEDTCARVGSLYSPYLWLEEQCEDMVQDHADQIEDILRFRDRVVGTGMRPNESLEEALCKELYPHCYKNKDKATATTDPNAKGKGKAGNVSKVKSKPEAAAAAADTGKGTRSAHRNEGNREAVDMVEPGFSRAANDL